MENSYKLSDGQTIIMQDDLNNNWHVFCENEDGSFRWHKEYLTKDEALKEFERWK